MPYARYGVGRYGDFDYGEGWDDDSADAVEGSVSEAKDCTVFLALSSDMDRDVSQYLTNLTTSGSGGYETSSTRADLTGEASSVRSMCAVFQWNTADTVSTIARHGSTTTGTTQTWRLEISGSDVVQLYVDGVVAVSVALPGVSGSDQRFLVAAQSFPNPDATVGFEIIHTLSALNVATGAWAHDQLIYTYASGSGYAFSVGGSWHGGVLNNAFTGTLESFRLDNAYVSTAEYCEDFGYGARPSGNATTTGTRQEAVRPGAAAFAANEYLGQGNLGFVAEAARKNDLRLAGPVFGAVLIGFDGTATQQVIDVTQINPRHTTTLGGFTYHAGLVFAMPVHRAIRRVRVRVFAANWVDSGGPQPSTVRVISSSKNPFGGTISFGSNAQAPKQYRTQLQITDGHAGKGVGNGAWYDLGVLTLATAPDSPLGPVEGLSGSTWIAVGWRFDGTNTSLQNLAIKALNIVPVIDDTGDSSGAIDTGGLAVP